MLQFHQAEISDANAIVQLVNSAYRGEVSRAGWTTEADLLEGVRTTTQEVVSIIKREDAFILIGVEREQIIASICCEWQALAGHNTAHFGMIAVKPNQQNKGHGKAMITAAEAITARKWRVVGYHMAVISMRHELIEFYERLGYKRTGEFVDFPKNPDLWQAKIEGLSLQYMAKLIHPN